MKNSMLKRLFNQRGHLILQTLGLAIQESGEVSGVKVRLLIGSKAEDKQKAEAIIEHMKEEQEKVKMLCDEAKRILRAEKEIDKSGLGAFLNSVTIRERETQASITSIISQNEALIEMLEEQAKAIAEIKSMDAKTPESDTDSEVGETDPIHETSSQEDDTDTTVKPTPLQGDVKG